VENPTGRVGVVDEGKIHGSYFDGGGGGGSLPRRQLRRQVYPSDIPRCHRGAKGVRSGCEVEGAIKAVDNETNAMYERVHRVYPYRRFVKDFRRIRRRCTR